MGRSRLVRSRPAVSVIDTGALVTWLRTQLDVDERDATPRVIVHSGGTPGRVVPNCIGASGHGCELGGWSIDPERVPPELWPDVEREHALLHASPAQRRALRDVEAKSQIVAALPADSDGYDARVRFGTWESCTEPCATDVLIHVLRLLATSYADRPGCRDDWRP